MKRNNLVLGIAAMALAIAAVTFSADPALANGKQGYGEYGGQMGHGYGQGHGMTGFQGQGHGMTGFQGQGHGMTGGQGQGHGMMGGQGQGHGMMGGQGQGHGAMGAMGSGNAPCGQVEQSGVDRNLGVDDVKGIVESRLKMQGNDRLKVGKVEASGENTIIAEIVTVDDSLVYKIEFNTKTGAHQPVK